MDSAQTTFHYYPSPGLRTACAIIGGFCTITLLALLFRLSTGGKISPMGAAVIALPIVFAAAVLALRISVTPNGMQVRRLTGSKLIPWADVARLEQTRTSFVIITKPGAVSLAWISASQRDRLFRQVLERAKLIFNSRKMRYGIVAEYIPRVQPITLIARKSAQNPAIDKELNR